MNRHQKQRIFELALFVGIPILLWNLFIYGLWKPLFFGVVLAVLFSGLYQRLCARLSKERAALVVVAVATFSTVIPTSGAIYYLVGVITELVTALQNPASGERQFVANLVSLVVPYLDPFIPEREGQTDIQRVIGLLSENLNSIAELSRTMLGVLYSGILGIGFGLVVILFSLYYFLVNGRDLLGYVEDIAPVRQVFIQKAYTEFSQMTKVILKVTALIGIVQGAIGGVGLAIIGTPNWFVWTIVMMIFSMLPVLGAGAVLIPTALVYLAVGATGKCLFVLVVFTVVSLVDNWMKPRIVGRDMEMNGGLVLLSVVGGLLSLDAIGFIAGPIIMALLVALLHTYHTTPPIDDEADESASVPATATEERK